MKLIVLCCQGEWLLSHFCCSLPPVKALYVLEIKSGWDARFPIAEATAAHVLEILLPRIHRLTPLETQSETQSAEQTV